MQLKVSPSAGLKGEIEVPGDKSISHRSVMFSALSDGKNTITNFLPSEDCFRTVECFRAMGVKVNISPDKKSLAVFGEGLGGLKEPKDILYVGNSGTTIRLMLGILAGQPFQTMITGDESIKRRPMKRVVDPLRKMGAIITGKQDGNFAPLEVRGGNLSAIEYTLPVASAQVKSALMLAALFAKGTTKIIEPLPSRDHTERMFGHFGIPFTKENNIISVQTPHAASVPGFLPANIEIPGDISSASFFIVAGIIIPDSEILIKNVGLNPTRTGIIDVLCAMGANIAISNEKTLSGEPRGDIRIKTSKLKGITIGGEIIPRLIDEIPIIAIAATQAEGQTVILDAKELRVKESDRVSTICDMLKKMGAKAKETPDGMIIEGPCRLKGAEIESRGDHRIAMSAAIAGLIAKDEMVIEDTECIKTSFPGFDILLSNLLRRQPTAEFGDTV
ncbi:MAG: 3-phosphoshikimate 1-carboxyvinyltransferase [Candidatus Margulisiibacteriota bacterium]